MRDFFHIYVFCDLIPRTFTEAGMSIAVFTVDKTEAQKD